MIRTIFASRKLIITYSILGVPNPLSDVPWRQSLRSNDQRTVWQGVQDLQPPIYYISMVSWRKNALQEDGSMSDLLKAEERLSDLSTGS